ncbi:MAG TPA: hypothetical protein DCQ52_07685, partial [Acidimicrobiaceae bacterium]|nr:hypothetical protein [Acidimicrobiaceae bacterium]
MQTARPVLEASDSASGERDRVWSANCGAPDTGVSDMHLSRIAGLVVISSVLVAASWDTTDTSAEVAPTAAAAPADADAGAPIAVANVT